MLHRGELSLEEQRNSLLQLDRLIPMQFSDTFRRSTYLEPERVLMLAVLEDAIYCLQKYATCVSGKNKKLFDETIRWVGTEGDDWPFSFDNVCDTVGLNAGRLRRALLQAVAVGYRVTRVARRPVERYSSIKAAAKRINSPSR